MQTSKIETDLQIIRTTPSHHNRILDITKSVAVFSEAEVSCVIELLEDYFQNNEKSCYHFLCCTKLNQVVGFICFGPRDLTDTAYDAYWIATDPRFRGMGVGNMLMKSAESVALENGAYMILAETSTLEKFRTTHIFLEKLGFRKVITINDFYDIDDNLVIYAKYLLPEINGLPMTPRI